MENDGLPVTGIEPASPTTRRPRAAERPGPRPDVAQALRGLTWKRFAVFCAALAFASLQGLGDPAGWVETPRAHLHKYFLWFATCFLWFGPPLLAVVATINLAQPHSRGLIWRLGLAISASAIGGRLLREAVFVAVVPGYAPLPPVMLAAGSLSGAMVAALGTAIYLSVVRRAQAMEDLQRTRLDGIGVERTLAEGRLLVLEAQIEPHFLFNSLANVRRLCQIDLDGGRRMLRHVSEYLAAALPQMRDADSTLGREVTLAEAYLRVQQIRMGERLAFAIDVPMPLRSARFPRLMLVTLVENAVKHGVGSIPEGGSIRIAARVHDDLLRVEVVDDGRGLQEHGGSGVGLANIDARLAFAYGRRARLKLMENPAKGATALIEIPLPVGNAPSHGFA